MNFIIRVDSSFDIGTGHVMRCLSLAQGLKDHGFEVRFICKQLAGNICDLISSKGFEIDFLKDDSPNGDKDSSSVFHSSWLNGSQINDAKQVKEIVRKFNNVCLIIDHYALDSIWEKYLNPIVKNIIVIDDLADRSHFCDFLIDQNMYKSYKSRYYGLIPERCTQLLGPKYAILRRKFSIVPTRIRHEINNILVFFGGVDKDGWTNAVVKQLASLKVKQDIVVVAGPRNPRNKEIESTCNKHGFHYLMHTDEMENLMVEADLSIGAVGTTTWERASVGLPSIVFAIADNQKRLASDIDGIIAYFINTELSDLDIGEYLKRVYSDMHKYQEIQNNCFEHVSPHGVENIISEVLSSCSRHI